MSRSKIIRKRMTGTSHGVRFKWIFDVRRSQSPFFKSLLRKTEFPIRSSLQKIGRNGIGELVDSQSRIAPMICCDQKYPAKSVIDDSVSSSAEFRWFGRGDRLQFVFLKECPVLRPAIKMTKATAPRKKMVSPGTRIQRSCCMSGVCRNSLLRAYQ